MPIDTERLILWFGIGASPGDTQSAEQPRKSLMFITPDGEPGLKMSLPDAWQPREPGLKNSGVWADGALQDGRTLLSDNVENVIEVITLQSTDSDFQTLVQRMAGIRRTIKEARQFTSTFYQIEPVYIEWSALGGFGSQYALVYNIDVNVEYVYPGAGQSMAVVTLTLEREPYWRGLPPGAHPRQWTFESRGLLAGKDWNWEDLNPYSTDLNSLAQGTVTLRNEYLLSTDDYDYPSVSNNWLDIDDSLIPGDAPALCMITIIGNTGIPFEQIFIARRSKPLELTARDGGGIRGLPLTVNAADASGLSAITDASRGMANASSGTLEVGRVTGASSASSQFPVITTGKLSWSAMRGRYLVYVRGFATSSTYTTGEVTLGLGVNSGLETYFSSEVDPAGAAVNVVQCTYMGTFEVPPIDRAHVGLSGGIFVADNAEMVTSPSSFTEIFFELDVTVAASRVYNIIDIVLIPIDEQCMAIQEVGTFDDLTTTDFVIADGTGYHSHGAPYEIAVGVNTIDSRQWVRRGLPIQGQFITLVPKKDNRLAFMIINSAVNDADTVRGTLTVKVDIVPRWIGVRDA